MTNFWMVIAALSENYRWQKACPILPHFTFHWNQNNICAGFSTQKSYMPIISKPIGKRLKQWCRNGFSALPPSEGVQLHGPETVSWPSCSIAWKVEHLSCTRSAFQVLWSGRPFQFAGLANWSRWYTNEGQIPLFAQLDLASLQLLQLVVALRPVDINLQVLHHMAYISIYWDLSCQTRESSQGSCEWLDVVCMEGLVAMVLNWLENAALWSATYQEEIFYWNSTSNKDESAI